MILYLPVHKWDVVFTWAVLPRPYLGRHLGRVRRFSVLTGVCWTSTSFVSVRSSLRSGTPSFLAAGVPSCRLLMSLFLGSLFTSETCGRFGSFVVDVLEFTGQCVVPWKRVGLGIPESSSLQLVLGSV